MDLWLKLEQARKENDSEIQKLERMINDNIQCEDLPTFLRPQVRLEIERHDKLERLMHEYQMHFNRKINTIGIELGLDGWRFLLEYCMVKNKVLEKITNIDIYRMKHMGYSCLEEGEIHVVPVSYQKNKLVRDLINFTMRFKQ